MADTLQNNLIKDARERLGSDDPSIKEILKTFLVLLEDASSKRHEIHAMTRENLECTKDVRRDLEDLKKRVDSLESGKVAKLEEAKVVLEKANDELQTRISTLEESYNFAFKKLPRIVATVIAAISLISGLVFGAIELTKDKHAPSPAKTHQAP